ncbi:magnesium-translocating P-type ATPase [Fischerella thermalis]|uniref:magnesium-translocating P-type ATPase n=3 Tax=Fischerella thermalis TaxID=372787 RepID=UPI000C800F1C|nr:magnesium-translocating P-type ATPase [Fischerella thermalis]PLZ33412.1 magnesium-translocating P-type ATPase [Fischerella thermalis WC559]PLZ34850.1 magnesium-translocating P-type ATPase [Fischerella thermalis WC558]PLZ41862.1 magnesium-translocating P-type ATPase [Fischerella thermalis WC542]PLZ51135.1 magnesium-translocating P-type ATPase [Fischerella thermalis WC439]PLZ51335.1 magnesium-translocating P-type ATPase [Fischerella thermalis WC442]
MTKATRNQRSHTEQMRLSMRVVEESATSIDQVLRTLNSNKQGLVENDALSRLKKFGKNEVSHEKPPTWYGQLLQSFNNPFVYILIGLAVVSYLTEDVEATIILTIMVVVSGVLRFVQEYRSTQAAEKLKALVSTTATVKRRNRLDNPGEQREIPINELVPGDIIHLAAGDMIPADVRLLSSKDLFVSQAVLTGESLPVEKYDTLGAVVEKRADVVVQDQVSFLDSPTICFMGTNVISGTAIAVVVATGDRTYFGSLAKNIVGKRVLTSFEQGVNRVSWLLIGFMAVMVPIVFLINGITKGNWFDAFLFGVSVAVGLTPEMLPMIVTANLAKGSVAMANQKVVVKRLNAIQNFGAMDVLCTDKTGTLTQDKIILERHIDLHGYESHEPLQYGYLNSYYQTGLKNLLDVAVLEHVELNTKLRPSEGYTKVDEIPFDFVRRRMSVVVEELNPSHNKHILICKGAVEEIFNICSHAKYQGAITRMNEFVRADGMRVTQQLNEDGFRVIAVAYKEIPIPQDTIPTYGAKDECDLILVGYLAFLDPPKDSASQAIMALQEHGVAVKIITGDNDIVTRKICQEVDLQIDGILLGSQMEKMSDEQLADMVDTTTVFAKMSPIQKAQIIRVLRSKGHTVGYMGDGINDAAALRDADVGISVDTAVDIAKESADIILLEKNLMVLERGVIEGRRTFANILKYLNMTASSNFGNVFSVMGSSAFLPFLPMQPIQLLTQNLLYDISQITIPFDNVDKDFLKKPQKWNVPNIGRFMLFIGPVSSIFDYVTFIVMWFVFGANTPEQVQLFNSGWFVEGLLSQTLIVHMIRTSRWPFLQSTASLPVLLLTGIIIAIGMVIPFTPLGAALGMVPLPMRYFGWLWAILGAYCLLTQAIKLWYIRIFGKWL